MWNSVFCKAFHEFSVVRAGLFRILVITMGGKRIFKGITEEEAAYYHSLLDEEITNFNCGELCAPDNGGEPFCCKVENAVPYLYKMEFTYLKRKSDLWSLWQPKTKYEINLKKNNESEDTVFCECKGVKHCERENRSITCRTFPLEPYLDQRGVFVGLVFMREFTRGCPLISRPKDIRQAFVDSHYIFWEKFLLRKEEEYEIYLKSSKSYRRFRKKTGKDFPIFLPSHLKGKEYLKEYL